MKKSIFVANFWPQGGTHLHARWQIFQNFKIFQKVDFSQNFQIFRKTVNFEKNLKGGTQLQIRKHANFRKFFWFWKPIFNGVPPYFSVFCGFYLRKYGRFWPFLKKFPKTVKLKIFENLHFFGSGPVYHLGVEKWGQKIEIFTTSPTTNFRGGEPEFFGPGSKFNFLAEIRPFCFFDPDFLKSQSVDDNLRF